MKSMQRKFGGLTAKKSADEADVGLVLNDFKTADEMLDRLHTDLAAFRDSWERILSMQCMLSGSLHTLYQPIDTEGSNEQRHAPAETPHKYMQKCHALQGAYANEQTDLGQEIGMLTEKLVKRAEDAKLHSKPLKKTIKHRENMKLDYERMLSKTESARKKDLRNQKEEMSLAKYESELAQARINYQTADDHVKENFPPVTEAIYSLLPFLLTTMVMLQTTLVGQLYTVLDEFTRQERLTNPAPGDSEIIAVWEQEFTSLRKEMENGLQVIAHGKAVHMPMTLPEKPTTTSGLGIRNKVMGRKPPPEIPRTSLGSRRSSSIHPDEEVAPAKPARPGQAANLNVPTPHWKATVASNGPDTSYDAPPPPYESKPGALTANWQQQRPSDHMAYTKAGASPRSPYALSPRHSPLSSPAPNKSNDYFDNRRTSEASSIASAAMAAVSAKKKPPPPVPVKRIPSATTQYVTALYDFEAQNHGDLAFREGDRIRVIKKTDSTEDWWEGELDGRSGSFPANYVKL